MPEQKPVPSRRMSYIVTYVRVELVATTEAAWPSGQRVGLAIQRSRVRVPL